MRKFGEFIIKTRVALFVVVFALTVLFSLYLPKVKMENNMKTWFSEDDPTFIKYDRFAKNFLNTDFILVAYEWGNPFSQSEITYLSYLTGELEEIPYVNEVTSLTTVRDVVGTEKGLEIKPLVESVSLSEEEVKSLEERIGLSPFYRGNLISKDNRTVGILLKVGIPKTDEDKKGRVEIEKEITDNIREILNKEHKVSGKIFHLGGIIITHNDTEKMMEKDIHKFLPLATIFVAIVLYLIFRSLPCVIISLITVLLALIWTLGFKGMVNSPMSPVSTTLFALIVVIGLANSIHFISHYHIELPRFKGKKDAVLETYKRAGLPCLFTSLTTTVGFGSLTMSPLVIIRNLGIFAGFGIMCAFILSMIIVPNALLLMKVGPKSKEYKKSKVLEWIGEFNLRNSRWILILGLLITLIMGIGIVRIHVEGSLLKYFKKDSPLRRDAEFLDKRLNGISSTEVIFYGHTDSFKDPEVLKKIDRFQGLVESHPKVSTSYSIAQLVKIINRALHKDRQEYFNIPETKEAIAQSLLLYEFGGGTEINEYTNFDYDMARVSIITKQMGEETRTKLIKEIEEYTAQNFKEFKVDITGFDNIIHEASSDILITQIQSLGLSLLIIFLMMIFVFGLRGGLVSILPNMFPIVFVLGLMGYAHFSLNMATATIAAIAIGLVVDDTIHYFSHFSHEFELSGNRELAMKNALQKVGRVICFTSLTLALGFFIFLFSEISILVDFAILSSIAVVTALLGDLFIGSILLVKLRVFSPRVERGQVFV